MAISYYQSHTGRHSVTPSNGHTNETFLSEQPSPLRTLTLWTKTNLNCSPTVAAAYKLFQPRWSAANSSITALLLWHPSHEPTMPQPLTRCAMTALHRWGTERAPRASSWTMTPCYQRFKPVNTSHSAPLSWRLPNHPPLYIAHLSQTVSLDYSACTH